LLGEVCICIIGFKVAIEQCLYKRDPENEFLAREANWNTTWHGQL